MWNAFSALMLLGSATLAAFSIAEIVFAIWDARDKIKKVTK